MKLLSRTILAMALLGAGVAGQEKLHHHLEAGGPLAVVPLVKPLAELPMQLGDWQGSDQPIDDPRLQYADEHLQRTYVHVQRRQAVKLWIAYSRTGADRGHHPEICMAVAGQPEDPAARRTLELPGGSAPVQQYRFGRPGSHQLVFYWHYTLPPPANSGLDALQRFYQRLRQRPASATIEVFAPEQSPDDQRYAAEFAGLVDEAVRSHLGPTAVRGSRRVPVTYVETHE